MHYELHKKLTNKINNTTGIRSYKIANANKSRYKLH